MSEWVSEWLRWRKYSPHRLTNQHWPHPCVSSQVIRVQVLQEWSQHLGQISEVESSYLQISEVEGSSFHQYQRRNFSLSRNFHSRTFIWISPLFYSRHWYITFCIDATLALVAEAEKQWPTSLTSQKKGWLSSWVKSRQDPSSNWVGQPDYLKSNSSLLIACTTNNTQHRGCSS